MFHNFDLKYYIFINYLYIDGELYSWGSNEFGQLGYGNKNPITAKPTLVKSLVGLPISFIACGGFHSFVVSKSGKINNM